MAEILRPNFITKLKTPVETVLESFNAEHARLPFDRVLCIGVYADGEAYYAFSDPDGGTCLWDMEMLKYQLVKVGSGDASDGS